MEGEKKCCKCEEFKWPDDPPLEVVWTDPADKEHYCVFHAPKDEKWKLSTMAKCTPEEFNALVHDRVESLQKSTASEEFLCFAGAVFPYDISFSKYDEEHPLCRTSFNSAEFCGKAEFSSTVFSKAVEFRNSCFYQNTDFGKAVFASNASFTCAQFSGDVVISQAEFKQCSNFDCSMFGGTASFLGVIFTGMTSFNEANFSCTAWFSTSSFASGAQFIKTTFSDKAYFVFVVLKGNVLFSDCTANSKSLLIYNLSSDSLSNLEFSLHEFPAFSFMGCRWPDRLAKDVVGGNNPALLTCEELYRAMKQQALDSHDQPQASRWHFREKLMQLKRLLNNKRSNDLLEVVEDHDAKWPARAWAWFKLLALPPYKPKLTLTGLYWATSGFGERAVRAGVWLVALLLLPFILNSPIGPWLSSIWAAIPYSASIDTLAAAIRDSISASAAMEYIPFTKDIKGEGWAKVGQALWQGVILLQATLFALAVRNRFRR